MSPPITANGSPLGVHVIAILALLCALPTSTHAKKKGPSREEVQRIVVEEAVRNRNVPPSLALAVARVESNFDPFARSHAGARGVMQIMPRTAWGEFRVRSSSLWDARTNAQLGVRFLEKLHRMYGQRWDLALSHYNGGAIKRDRRGRLEVHSYTRDYVDKVLRISRRYERDASVIALVRRSGQAGEGSNADEERELAYWMYETAGTQRDWRDYLKAADHWLEEADDRSRGKASGASGKAVQQNEREPAYWDDWGMSGMEQRQSRTPQRGVSETRRRFRQSLAAEREGRRL